MADDRDLDNRDDHRDHDRIVPLGTYPSPLEAEVAVSVLEEQGIRATFAGMDVGGAYPSIAFVDGVTVQVFEADRERALAALEAEEVLPGT